MGSKVCKVWEEEISGTKNSIDTKETCSRKSKEGIVAELQIAKWKTSSKTA